MQTQLRTLEFPKRLWSLVELKSAGNHASPEELVTYCVWSMFMNSANVDQQDFLIEICEEIYGECHQYWENVDRTVQARVTPGSFQF